MANAGGGMLFPCARCAGSETEAEMDAVILAGEPDNSANCLEQMARRRHGSESALVMAYSMVRAESDGLFGRVSGAEAVLWALSWLAPFYSPPASIGLRTFGGPSANAGWAVQCIDSRKTVPFLPLTCICARCRDSAQHPCFAEFRHAWHAAWALRPSRAIAEITRAFARCALALRERGIGEQRGKDRCDIAGVDMLTSISRHWPEVHKNRRPMPAAEKRKMGVHKFRHQIPSQFCSVFRSKDPRN